MMNFILLSSSTWSTAQEKFLILLYNNWEVNLEVDKFWGSDTNISIYEAFRYITS